MIKILGQEEIQPAQPPAATGHNIPAKTGHQRSDEREGYKDDPASSSEGRMDVRLSRPRPRIGGLMAFAPACFLMIANGAKAHSPRGWLRGVSELNAFSVLASAST